MNQQAKTNNWAVLLPLIAVFIWALNVAVTRYVADYISPVSISFYRWLVAFLILTPFMSIKLIREWSSIRPYLPKLAVLSAFGMARAASTSHSGLLCRMRTSFWMKIAQESFLGMRRRIRTSIGVL